MNHDLSNYDLSKHDLSRFLEAQDGVFEIALNELKGCQKRSHWMWFIFPQLDGLGYSELSKKYAIRNLSEASAYWKHPVLGSRLEQLTRVVLQCKAHPKEIFGAIDYQKFISCMTLFMLALPECPLFASVLQKYSEIDNKTKELLGLD